MLAAAAVVGYLSRAAWAFYRLNPGDDPLVLLAAGIGYGVVSFHLLVQAALSLHQLIRGGPP
jgi:hypothetical protein